MNDAADLAGLLVARVCHDLAGPVGALANGAELVADEPDPEIRAEFLAMVADGAAKLAVRLRFLRLTYGGGPGVVTSADARAALAGWLEADGRHRLEWRVAADCWPREDARLRLALAVLAAESAAGRGVLAVDDEGVALMGVRAALSAEAVAVLAGASPDASALPVPAAVFARAVANRLGARLRVGVEDDELRIEIERG